MLKPVIACSMLACSLTLAAADSTQIGRYTTVINQPLKAQLNPLHTVQQIHFPASVHTLGDAVTYWLNYSGYRLASTNKQHASLQLVLQQPLPQVSRNLGPLSVADGLLVLVGSRIFSLKQDELAREVNFNVITRSVK